jgi:hypothetical protein
LMNTTYRSNFRLIGHFHAEIRSLQNDSFSNFDLKFLFCKYSDFTEIFFEKSRSLWFIRNLKNIAGIALSAPVQNKKPKFWGIFQVLFLVFSYFFSSNDPNLMKFWTVTHIKVLNKFLKLIIAAIKI